MSVNRNITHNNKKVNRPEDIEVEFSGKNITPFGGVILFRKFFKAINLEKLIKEYVRIEKRKSKYTISDLFLSLVYLILSGIERISHSEVFKDDEVFKKIIDIENLATRNTFWRFILKFNKIAIDGIKKINLILFYFFQDKIIKDKTITLDFDLHVIPVYGRKQRAKVGYNPKRKGYPSYMPFFCFIAEGNILLNAKYRSGKTPTGYEMRNFIRDSINKIPKEYKIYARLDGEFYCKEVVEYLNNRGIKFVVVASITEPVIKHLSSLSYKDIGGGYSTARFRYKPKNWRKEYNFIVRREEIKEEKDLQRTLFKMQEYVYRVIVSNIEDLDEEIWRFYDKHANVENAIKELVHSFHINSTPSSKYLANVAYFHIVCLTYNLFIYFKKICLPKGLTDITAETLRLKFIIIAAKLIRTARKLILQISEYFRYKFEFKFALNRIFYFDTG